MQEIDYIVVGQGLAGSILSYEMVERGMSVRVFNREEETTASKVAAGLINPLTGKRLVIDGGFGENLEVAKRFYEKLEKAFGRKVLHEREQVRYIGEGQEKILEKRLGDEFYREYIELMDGEPLRVRVKESYYVDTRGVLEVIRGFLKEKEMYEGEGFEYEGVEIEEGWVEYKGLKAKGVVFCEGAWGVGNPYFPDNELEPCKGEILTLGIDGQEFKRKLLNGPKWLLHTEGEEYRAGATYEWDDLSDRTTDRAKNEILEALKAFQLEESSVKVLEQKAALRPTSVSRTPIMKVHPKYTNLVMFNGFGSKGSLMIPRCVELMLLDFMH